MRRRVQGRPVYDERMLCHSPQERLFIDGAWREGLLPPLEALPAGERDADAGRVPRLRRGCRRARRRRARSRSRPRARAGPRRWRRSTPSPSPPGSTRRGLRRAGPALVPRLLLPRRLRRRRGAGLGLGRPPLLRQPARLPRAGRRRRTRGRRRRRRPHLAGRQRLAGRAPGGAARRAPACRPRRAAHPRRPRRRRARRLECRDPAPSSAGARRGWSLATPLFVAARLLESPPPALLARRRGDAPCAVAGRQPAARRARSTTGRARRPRGTTCPTAAPRSATSTRCTRARGRSPGRPCSPPTGRSAARARPSSRTQRARLLSEDWRPWAGRVVADLATMHPDLPAKLRRIDLMRYGHAMSIPIPGVRSSAALQALAAPQKRLQFAHADLSSYSVFEEAFFHGTRAGRSAAAHLGASEGTIRCVIRNLARAALGPHEEPSRSGPLVQARTELLLHPAGAPDASPSRR